MHLWPNLADITPTSLTKLLQNVRAYIYGRIPGLLYLQALPAPKLMDMSIFAGHVSARFLKAPWT